MIQIIDFDYDQRTVTVTKQVDNVIYIEIMPWDEIKLRCLDYEKN